MKTSIQLEKEIQQSLDRTPLLEILQKPYWDKVQKFTTLVEHFGSGNVPEKYLEEFKQNYRKDFILETLTTHDWRYLAAALQDSKFGRYIREATSMLGNFHGRAVVVLTLQGDRLHPVRQLAKDLKTDPDFIKILDFYGYFYTQSRGPFVYLEPKFAEDANDFVYNQCHGIGYHITNRKNAERIERVGLRVKNGYPEKDSERKGYTPYREFPSRIYFISLLPEMGQQKIKEYLLHIARGTLGKNEDSIAIFKIMLSGNVYEDPAMNTSNNSFYTYTNIPANRVKRIF